MCCNPRYVNDHVTGNCFPMVNSIETRIVRLAHDKIDSKTNDTLQKSWSVWFGKKIVGDNRINQIAEDKRSKAKEAACIIIPGVCCRVFRDVFLLFLLTSVAASLFSTFMYFVLTVIANPDELFYVRLVWGLIIIVSYLFVIYNKTSQILLGTQKDIEIRIKSAI